MLDYRLLYGNDDLVSAFKGKEKTAGVRGTLEKCAILGFGIPVADLGNGNEVSLGLPYGVGIQHNFRRDKVFQPGIGIGLLGPYFSAGIAPGNAKKKEKPQELSIKEYLQARNPDKTPEELEEAVSELPGCRMDKISKPRT